MNLRVTSSTSKPHELYSWNLRHLVYYLRAILLPAFWYYWSLNSRKVKLWIIDGLCITKLSMYLFKNFYCVPKSIKIHIFKMYLCQWCGSTNCLGLGLRPFLGKTKVFLGELGCLVTHVASVWYAEVGKSRSTLVNMWKEFILVLLLLINDSIIFHMDNCKSIVAHPCICPEHKGIL